jgi:hypothetical protein
MRPMSRFTHALFTLLAALSLLLCVAAVGVWVKSFWLADSITLRRISPQAGLMEERSVLSTRGRVAFARDQWQIHPGFYASPADMQKLVDQAGLSHTSIRPEMRLPLAVRYVVPHWVVPPVFAALPMAYLWRRSRDQRRSRTGLCPTCGYDLRASPERCPECGAEKQLAADEHG